MTNLEYLQEQIEPFSFADRQSIHNYLLGILSVSDPEEWQKNVALALQCHHSIQVQIAKAAKQEVSR